jgi:hypothetical protein
LPVMMAGLVPDLINPSFGQSLFLPIYPTHALVNLTVLLTCGKIPNVSIGYRKGGKRWPTSSHHKRFATTAVLPSLVCPTTGSPTIYALVVGCRLICALTAGSRSGGAMIAASCILIPLPKFALCLGCPVEVLEVNNPDDRDRGNPLLKPTPFPGDLGPDEPTRRCPHCLALVHRRDEQSGKCPACGGILLRLWR